MDKKAQITGQIAVMQGQKLLAISTVIFPVQLAEYKHRLTKQYGPHLKLSIMQINYAQLKHNSVHEINKIAEALNNIAAHQIAYLSNKTLIYLLNWPVIQVKGKYPKVNAVKLTDFINKLLNVPSVSTLYPTTLRVGKRGPIMLLIRNKQNLLVNKN